MGNISWHGIFFLAFLPTFGLQAEGSHIAWGDTAAAEDLIAQISWLVDEPAQLDAEAVWAAEEGAFLPFDALQGSLPRGAALWGRFQLSAAAAGDSSIRYLVLMNRHDRFALYTRENGAVQAQQAGSIQPYRSLPFPDNCMAIPVSAYAGGAREMLIRVRNEDLDHLNLKSLRLLTAEQERQMRAVMREARRYNDLYYLLFFSVTGFLFLVYGLQWFIHRERAVLFYALYLVANALYYWRNFELYRLDIQTLYHHVAFLHYHFEVLLTFVICYLYIKFVSSFLDIPQTRPALARHIGRIAWAVLWAIPALWLVQFFFGTQLMYQFFTFMRIALFVPAFAIIAHTLLESRRRLAAFILVGGLVLLLSTLPPVLSKLPGFGIQKAAGGTVTLFSLAGIATIPVYDFKIGLLLEFLCFSAGLAYKQKLLREENRELNDRLAQSFSPNENNGQNTHAPSADGNPAAAAYPFPLDSDFARRVTACIEKNLQQECFGVEELARAMHLSRTHLYRRIKQSTGLKPLELIRKVRLAHAYLRLQKGEQPVSQIAYELGFGSHSNFSQWFKEVYGVSPSGVRKGGEVGGRLGGGK